MTNAELIDSLRNVYGEKADCYHCHSPMGCYGTACMEYLCHAAADALEAAEKRIDGLQKLVDINTKRCEALRKQLREANESYDKRIAELEAQLPKEGEWIIKPHGTYGQLRAFCSVCGKHSGIGGIVSNQKKPYCPNCGARMKGENDDNA